MVNGPQHLPNQGTHYKWILGAVVGVVLIVFLYILYYPAANIASTKRGPWSLSTNVEVMSKYENKTIMINDQDEALQFFVYLDGNMKMGQTVNSGSGGPSPDTGLYQQCACRSATDCSTCVPHSGYRTLINIQDTIVLEILNTPDASRQKSVSAEIYVKTQNNESYNIETFPLPPLPEQKWTMITISKQGRQINVYYNTTLVLAKKAQNNFASTVPTCSPITVGAIGLSGNIALLTYFTSHQTIQDVIARYQDQVDTRGNLNTMNVVPTSNHYSIVDSQQSSFIKTLCLDLSCFRHRSIAQAVPNIPPIYNTLETSYA